MNVFMNWILFTVFLFGAFASEEVENQISKYIGVSWHTHSKQWKAELSHNKKICYGGLFDNEEHAAMKVNLLCDKFEIERRNPTINVRLDEKIRQLENKNCPGNHGLNMFVASDEGWYCSECKKEVNEGESLYGCHVCDFDLCMNCLKKSRLNWHGGESNFLNKI